MSMRKRREAGRRAKRAEGGALEQKEDQKQIKEGTGGTGA